MSTIILVGSARFSSCLYIQPLEPGPSGLYIVATNSEPSSGGNHMGCPGGHL